MILGCKGFLGWGRQGGVALWYPSKVSPRGNWVVLFRPKAALGCTRFPFGSKLELLLWRFMNRWDGFGWQNQLRFGSQVGRDSKMTPGGKRIKKKSAATHCLLFCFLTLCIGGWRGGLAKFGPESVFSL